MHTLSNVCCWRPLHSTSLSPRGWPTSQRRVYHTRSDQKTNQKTNQPRKLHTCCIASPLLSALRLLVVARCCSLLFVSSLSMTIVVLLVKMSMPLSRNRFASSHFGNYTSSGLDNASNGTLWFCYCLRTSQRVCERTSGSILLRVGVTFIVFKEKHRGGWCVLFTE